MMGVDGKVVVLRIYMESSNYIYNYTGKITKSILLTEVPELEHLFKPSKGYFKQLRVSPPLNADGAVFTSYEVKYSNGKVVYDLRPVMLGGEYVVEVGAPTSIADTVYSRFKQVVGVRTRLKFENTILTYLVEDVRVDELRIQLKNPSYVVIKSLSPALLPNPLVPNQQVRRFTTSPGVLLWIPRMMSEGFLTSRSEDVRRRYLELEECLSEHYSTKHKIVFINYDNNREPAVMVKAKYIVVAGDCETKAWCVELLEKTLTAARTYGVGASRANGFGTITVSSPDEK